MNTRNELRSNGIAFRAADGGTTESKLRFWFSKPYLFISNTLSVIKADNLANNHSMIYVKYTIAQFFGYVILHRSIICTFQQNDRNAEQSQ